MQNAGLSESQTESRLPREISTTSDMQMITTLMAEIEEKLNSLWIRVKKESEKVGLQLNIQKTKIMASDPITSWQIGREKVEAVTFYLLELQNHCRWWVQPWY